MPTKRACTACHRVKCRCVFSQEIQSKCDRCIRLGMDCVPHVSRQGKRKPKAENMTHDSESCHASVSQDQTMDKVPSLRLGSNLHVQANLFTQSEPGKLRITSQSQEAPSSHTIHQPRVLQFSLDEDLAGIRESRLSTPPMASNTTLERAASTTRQQQTTSTRHRQQCDIGKNPSLSDTSIPLRQWINYARNFVGNSHISPQYLDCCLRIAVSLSKRFCDAEELSCCSLPLDMANWAKFVVVKLRKSGADHLCGQNEYTASQNASDNLDLLEAWLDDICEENEMDKLSFHNPCFYNVDFADFFAYDTKLIEKCADYVSSQDQRQRIYALGLVFYELFSGGRSPPPDVLPCSVPQDPGATHASCGVLNLSDLNLTKLDVSNKGMRNEFDRRKKQPDPQAPLHSCIELLRGIGLPYRLCDLLFNMIDCVNGDLSGDDAYTNMSEVTSDLQLMIDKPLKFLHDPDVVTISTVGLQLKQISLPRDREFTSLQQAYNRSTEGSSEFAIIAGGSGTGKSYLAFQLGRHITSCGGIFLSVKFNQLTQTNPLSALVSAFNQYCNIFTEMKDSDWVKSIATKLRGALGQDANHLIKVIPKLSEILDCEAPDAALDQDCVNGLHKIHYLLIRFVEVISTCSKVTVTLHLDDLQWADSFSLSVLEQILKMPEENKSFFFVGCYRANEMVQSHPFMKIVDNAGAFGIRLTMIRLDCMDKDTVNTMVSELLCLSPRLVRSLSEIVYSKTKGNILFFSRLLISLNTEGLLNLSLGRRRWVWDEEQIQSRKLPNDVASFFSQNIRTLSPQVQSALQVLSCLGSADEMELSILESNLNLEVVNSMKVAVEEGFVSKDDRLYHFSHDKIHQAAYEMAQVEDRRLEHLQYGICLLKFLDDTADVTGMLFTAVGQINLAGPSVVTDQRHYIEFAAHNLMACKKAMGMSEYTAASAYAKNGILFIKEDNPWRVHYTICLNLFELAIKCMLVLGDFDTLTKLSDEVYRNARSLGDKLDTLFALMTSFAYASKIKDSVDMGLSILSQLGHELPISSTLKNAMCLVKQTLQDLDVPDNELLSYKKMTDTRHLMAMKCLAKLEMTTGMVDSLLHPIVTCEMIKLTIHFGLSPTTPVGFAYFAGILLKQGDMLAGFRFAKLAMQMLDQVGSKEFAGDVILRSTQVLCFHLPLLSVNEYRLRGQEVALAVGDVPFACGLKLIYCVTMFWAGSNLLTVKDVYAQDSRYMKGQNHLTTYNCIILSYQSILALVGEPINEEVREDQLTNPFQRLTYYFQHMYLSFLLNIHDELRQHAQKFFEFRKVYECKMSIWYAMHEFYGGLVSFFMYRETGDTVWLDRGKQCTSSMRLWAEHGSSWNFAQKLYLLEAEEHYCQTNLSAARESYKSAISSSRLHKFVNDEALACELAGYFYLQVGIAAVSREHLECAHENYIKWGAGRKVNKIFDFIRQTFECNSADSCPIMIKGQNQDQDLREQGIP